MTMPRVKKATTPQTSLPWQNYAKIPFTLPSGAQGRITVGICSVRDGGRHSRYLWEAQEYIKQNYEDSTIDIFSDHHNDLIALRHRAAMLASFRRYEYLNGDGSYHEADLPGEWVDIHTFMDAMPKAVYDAWLEGTILLNPDLLDAQIDDEKKKGVSVAIEYSTSL